MNILMIYFHQGQIALEVTSWYPRIQCPKLSMHPTPGVPIFGVGCMVFKGVHTISPRPFVITM